MSKNYFVLCSIVTLLGQVGLLGMLLPCFYRSTSKTHIVHHQLRTYRTFLGKINPSSCAKEYPCCKSYYQRIKKGCTLQYGFPPAPPSITTKKQQQQQSSIQKGSTPTIPTQPATDNVLPMLATAYVVHEILKPHVTHSPQNIHSIHETFSTQATVDHQSSLSSYNTDSYNDSRSTSYEPSNTYSSDSLDSSGDGSD